MKLFCCRYCRYSTDQEFHFNWHMMNHTGELPHSCNVCNKREENESSNHSSSNFVKIEVESDDDTPAFSMIGKRSVATATTDDLLLIGSHTPLSSCRLTSNQKDSNHYSQESHQMSGNSMQDKKRSNKGSIQNQRYNQASDEEDDQDDNDDDDDDEDEDDDEEDDEEEEAIEEDEGEEEEEKNADNSSQNGTTLMPMAPSQPQDEISDEDDDEEEEVESEEDGEQDYLTSDQVGTNDFYSEIMNQGPPYSKSTTESATEMPIASYTPTSSKGRGKGNRKSRSINSMDSSDGSGGGETRRKFHCSHCGKSFKTKSHLQRHILTHTGEKPYHCNRCGAKFNQSSSLRNHIIAIHTKEYPHYCPQCGKGFLMPALLQKHLTTSHRNK